MSFVRDVTDAKQRFGTYIEDFRYLLVQNDVHGSDWYQRLKEAHKNQAFKSKRDAIWHAILEREGGKLSLGAIFGIIGAALGAIGVAGFGGAIGIPLALLLVPVGILFGHEVDEHHITENVFKWFRDRFGSAPSNAPPTDSHAHASPDNTETNTATGSNQKGSVNYDEELVVILQIVSDVIQRCEELDASSQKLEQSQAELYRDVAKVRADHYGRLLSNESALHSISSRVVELERTTLPLQLFAELKLAVQALEVQGSELMCADRTFQAQLAESERSAQSALEVQGDNITQLKLTVEQASESLLNVKKKLQSLFWSGLTVSVIVLLSIAWLIYKK